jgi:hypothetical protein
LGGNCLDLGDDTGLDELAEVGTAKVQQTGVEEVVLEVELAKVETAKDTEAGNGGQIGQLLQQEERVEVEDLVVDVKESIELAKAEVLLESELLEDAEVVDAVVETEDVVEVGRLEAVELLAAEEVIEATLLNLLLSGGRSDQGGEGRNDNSGGLHLDGCCVGMNDSSLSN